MSDSTQCKICNHPELRLIDMALSTGDRSLAILAQRFATSEDSLSRHRRDHLRDIELPTQVDSKMLLAKLLQNQTRAERAYQDAGDTKQQIEALREVRQTTDAIAKLIGAHRSIDIKQIIPFYMKLKRMVLEILKDLPDKREELLLALEKAETDYE